MMEDLILKGQNPLGLFNASDPRFQKNKARPVHCWQTVQLKDFHYHFPVFNPNDAVNLEVGEFLDLHIDQPFVQGMPLHIKLIEYLDGTEWDLENLPKSAKQVRLTLQMAENGQRYVDSDGEKGMSVSQFIMDNITDLVGLDQETSDVAYFVTEAYEPIFRRTNIEFGPQKHKQIEFQMLVHHSELPWAEKVDITENNKAIEEEVKELKLP